jgi:sporulation protein YlmC with PRC-barrel domain
MLLSANTLSDYKIEATDGNIGHVDCFLFDERSWAIRYLVVNTGSWLTGRMVILVPSVLDKPETPTRVFPVELTRQQVKDSPDIDTDQPVSRQQEIKLHEYYGWATYWQGDFGPILTARMPVVPGISGRPIEGEPPKVRTHEEPQAHLRSTKELVGYKIHATDGEIGYVEDFIVNTKKWHIQYLVVDTQKWVAGKKVLVPPNWITRISWEDSEVLVDVTKEKIKDSPEFDPASPVNREYEVRLYDYYGRPKYWI